MELELPGYHQFWNSAEKKGYSGVAVFTRAEPLSVTYGLGLEEHDHEGRVITANTPGSTWSAATPQCPERAQAPGLPDDLGGRLPGPISRPWTRKKPVILCGDLNVAHQEIDLKNPKTNRRNAGFTDEERGKMTQLLSAGFTDTFRAKYPDAEGAYSWWSYRFHAREKNAGWRIDYFIVSDRLMPQVREAAIHSEIYGSDHCPVELVLDL